MSYRSVCLKNKREREKKGSFYCYYEDKEMQN